jgi:hypothetical protein
LFCVVFKANVCLALEHQLPTLEHWYTDYRIIRYTFLALERHGSRSSASLKLLAVKKGFSGPFGARALLLALARQHLTQIF